MTDVQLHLEEVQKSSLILWFFFLFSVFSDSHHLQCRCLHSTGCVIIPCCSLLIVQVVNFVCPVRASHTQTLSVFNPTNQRCTIRPVIEGEQWSAVPFLTLEPLQNKTYEITYRPLTMAADGKKHLVQEH